MTMRSFNSIAINMPFESSKGKLGKFLREWAEMMSAYKTIDVPWRTPDPFYYQISLSI